MKKVISLVCLFLISIHTVMYENDFDSRFEEVKKITDIVELSKELNVLYGEIEQENDSLNKIILRNIYEKENCRKREDYFEQKRKDIENLIPFYMDCFQMNFDTQKLDEYEQYNDLLNRYRKLEESIDQSIETNQEKVNENLMVIERIEAYQQILQKTYQQEEIREKGEYDINSMINGYDDLPEYGGYYEDIQADGVACLAMKDYSIDSFSEKWILPITNGNISAGTWAYPSGNLHLGMDFACPMYSNVVAPANGIILYANACVEDNCGYLGNWCGWPAGGGNTVCMICAVNNSLFAVTFAHLSSKIYVYPGQQVNQGDLLALSGNSGNSTGPHCHIEVFSVRASLDQLISYFVQGADFSFGNGYSKPATCSDYACRIRPESVWG